MGKPKSHGQQTPGTSRSTPSKTPTRRKPPTPSGSAKRKTATPSRLSTSRNPQQRRRRYRPGIKALLQIRQMQDSTALCIRRLPFGRLVREIQMKVNPRITGWNVNAVAALQEACEAYLVRFFQDCQTAANFANRVTVMTKDMHFIQKIRGSNDI